MKLVSRAGVVAGTYMVVAGAYIVLSGQAARAMADSVDALERLERYKGIAFVVVTGLALFLVTYLVLRKQQTDADQAQRAREALLKAERNALAGLFVSSVAHDASNLAMVISSSLELLDDEHGLDPDARRSLDDAREAMQTLTRLFKDLKEMGRDRNRSLVPMELGAIARRIADLLRGHGALRHCAVTVDAPVAISLPVFPVLIDQVLINLLLNAGEATEGRGRIVVRVRANGDHVRLEVHDDGKGVPSSVADSLFKPFTSTKPQGTGLGLVSVRECALAHGGYVEYDRSDLGGAAFRVALPLTPPTSGSPETRAG
ncbi:MAG: HAMP domain-containing histidine kinase [Gemmatimonadetes bacterium]|nr:HAMP domain-containing histidine kinase [Gemmatimonadota bacterium]